jgi:hypothetical protein
VGQTLNAGNFNNSSFVIPSHNVTAVLPSWIVNVDILEILEMEVDGEKCLRRCCACLNIVMATLYL